MDFKDEFSKPLQTQGAHLKTYYVFVADGAGRFDLGLISESRDSDGEVFLREFVKNLESRDFHGYAMKFKNVLKITEDVSLMAGVHRPGSQDGTFDVNSEKSFARELSSVREWEEFTDHIGGAFLSKNANDFRSGLEWLFGGPEAFIPYALQVLAHDDVAMVELNPTVVLDDGTVIGAESPMTPFFNVPFVRECWAEGYEHGKCFSAH